jgi:hypothetical protein
MHTGRPIIREIGKGRQRMVIVLCPYGHVVTGQPMSSWAGGWLEAKASEPTWTVQCDGTVPAIAKAKEG